jgi:hypothetical protein
MNEFLTVLADSSPDCAVLCVAYLAQSALESARMAKNAFILTRTWAGISFKCVEYDRSARTNVVSNSQRSPFLRPVSTARLVGGKANAGEFDILVGLLKREFFSPLKYQRRHHTRAHLNTRKHSKQAKWGTTKGSKIFSQDLIDPG